VYQLPAISSEILLITWTILPIALPGIVFAFNRQSINRIALVPNKAGLINSISSSALYLSSFFAVSYSYSWINNAEQVVLLAVTLRILNVTGVYALWTQVHIVDYKSIKSTWTRPSFKFILSGFAHTLFTLVAYFLIIKIAFPELKDDLLDIYTIAVAALYVISRNASALINAILLANDKVKVFVVIEGVATTVVMLVRENLNASFINAFASIAAFQFIFVLVYTAYLIKFKKME
jgi:hypothetical protein